MFQHIRTKLSAIGRRRSVCVERQPDQALVTDHLARTMLPSPDVRASLQEDGAVFLHLRSGAVFRSNRIGAAIWKGLAARQDLATIASQIGHDYGVPVEEAERDAAGFAAQLEAHGFLCQAGS